MRGGRFSAAEGANVSMAGGGSKERLNAGLANPMTRHFPGSRAVDVSNKCTVSKQANLTSGIASTPQALCHKESKTSGRRLVVRLLPCVSSLRLTTLCFLLIHCSACFSVSRLSDVPASLPCTNASDSPLATSSAGIIAADAADAVAAGETVDSAAESGASAARTNAGVPPAETAAFIRAANIPAADATAGPVTATPAAGFEFSRAPATAEVGNNVASGSLLSTQQAASIPGRLPAGYQTYREMLGLLRTLAASQCPELELTQRRNGQLKLDVVKLKRNNSSSGGDSSESPTQQQERVFILSGEHPRELLPPAVLLHFIQLLCGMQPAAPAGPRNAPLLSSSSSFLSAAARGRQQQEDEEDESEGEEKDEEEDKEEAGSEELQDAQDSSSRDNRGSSDRSEEDGGEGPDRFQKLLDRAEFQIVLNANPFARKKVEEGEYCRRGTLNNVDLNRNWGAFWEASTQEESEPSAVAGTAGEEKKAAASAGELLTGGPSPFSEPETQLLKQLLLQFHPTLFISLHSGSLGVFTPFGYADYKPHTHGKRLQEVAHSIAHSPRCRNVDSGDQCVAGTAGQYFSAKGNCLDWVYTAVKPTPLAFLVEIYRGQNDASALPEQGTAPTTESLQVGGVTAAHKPKGEENDVAGVASGSEAEVRPQQRFTFAQTQDADGGAAHPAGLSGVRTPGNNLATKDESTGRHLFGARRRARINPHFSSTSFRERNVSLLQLNARTGHLHLERPAGSAGFSNSSSSSSSSHNSGAESDRRRLEAEAVNTSFLETRNGATSAAANAAVAGQLFSGVHTPEDCFRMFNPHTTHSREEALHNWAEVLRQLIEEARAPLEGET